MLHGRAFTFSLTAAEKLVIETEIEALLPLLLFASRNA
jgi:hypothetical protein